jgi:hypothetical protein
MDSSALIGSESEGVRFELELRPVRRRPTSNAISPPVDDESGKLVICV